MTNGIGDGRHALRCTTRAQVNELSHAYFTNTYVFRSMSCLRSLVVGGMSTLALNWFILENQLL